MVELEVYVPGVRALDKIMELDHALSAQVGLRYKVDSNHDIVYMEFDEPPSLTSAQVRDIFSRLGLSARFVGSIPVDLQPKSKTQRIKV
ncbi:MAG: hypothetical protein JO295_00715 [Verrucomicrobia bacterium]|nr:hypothetical protein [Verrucomicrobiota bacterium]